MSLQIGDVVEIAYDTRPYLVYTNWIDVKCIIVDVKDDHWAFPIRVLYPDGSTAAFKEHELVKL